MSRKSVILNWTGVFLIIIGIGLILSAIIYVENKSIIDTTFRIILFSGILLLIIGFLVELGGHWNLMNNRNKIEKNISENVGSPF